MKTDYFGMVVGILLIGICNFLVIHEQASIIVFMSGFNVGLFNICVSFYYLNVDGG